MAGLVAGLLGAAIQLGVGAALQDRKYAGLHLNQLPPVHNPQPVHQPYQIKTPYSGGRVRGLFIGINYKGQSAELRGCVNDVTTMLRTLNAIDFPLHEAVILVDDPSFPGLAGYPTKENLLKWMRWLVHDARPGDTFFLHYSGHGGQQRNTNGTEASGYDSTMIPLDYQRVGSILDNDLFDILVRPLPAGARLTAVMDCCHSGSIMDLPYEFRATQQAMSMWGGGASASAFHRTSSAVCAGDVMMFSGCGDTQTSADAVGANFQTAATHPAQAGGACTNALSETFTKTQGLTFVQILETMRASLKRRGFKQEPQLSCTKPIDLRRGFSMFGALDQFAFTAAPMPQTWGPPAQPPQMYAPPGAYPPPQAPSGYPPMSPGGYPQQGGAYPPPQPGPMYAPPGAYAPGPQMPGYPPAGGPGYPPGYPPAGGPGYPAPAPQGYPGYPPPQPGYPGQHAPPGGYHTPQFRTY